MDVSNLSAHCYYVLQGSTLFSHVWVSTTYFYSFWVFNQTIIWVWTNIWFIKIFVLLLFRWRRVEPTTRWQCLFNKVPTSLQILSRKYIQTGEYNLNITIHYRIMQVVFNPLNSQITWFWCIFPLMVGDVGISKRATVNEYLCTKSTFTTFLNIDITLQIICKWQT